MKKICVTAFATASLLALSACGGSESADEAAKAESVEMPAEEAMGGVDAMPMESPSGMASDMASGMPSEPAAPDAMASASASAAPM